MQVDARQGLQQGIGGLCVLFVEVAVQDAIHFFGDGFPGGARFQQQVGIELVPAHPVEQARVRVRRHGDQEREVEMGTLRDSRHHTGHGVLGFIIQTNDLPQWVAVAETPLGHRFGQDDAVGLGQRLVRVALAQWPAEDIEYRRVGEQPAFLVKPFVADLHQRFSVRQEPAHLFHFRDIRPGRLPPVEGHLGDAVLEGSSVHPGRHPHNAVLFGVVLIVAQLEVHVGPDEQAAGESQGDPQDIDERIAPLPDQAAEGDLEGVKEHGRLFRKWPQ